MSPHPHTAGASTPSKDGHKDFPYSRPGTPVLHPNKSLGFIGIGSMGYYMARNLAQHSDIPLLVYNRTRSKSEKLVAELGPNKIKIAESVAEIVTKSDLIFTNLASDEVVTAVYEDIASTLKEHTPTHNKIFVETSTIYPTLAGVLDAKITKFAHTHFVAAPVFGAPPAADKAQLIVVMAGEYKIKKEVAYLIVPAMGRKIIDMGGNVEKAPALKLIGNAFILGSIELLAETMTLADKSGVGASNFYDIIKELFPAVPIIGYGKKILNDEFDGTKGFALSGGLKDATHVRKLAAESNSPVPTIDIAHQNLITARALHASPQSPSKSPFSVLDWSALAAGARVAAGLPGFDSAKHGGVQLEDE